MSSSGKIVTAATVGAVDAGRLRVNRTAVPAILAGATADVVVTFATAFADLLYTVTASVEGASLLRVQRILARTATTVTVRVVNDDAVASTDGILHTVAVHD